MIRQWVDGVPVDLMSTEVRVPGGGKAFDVVASAPVRCERRAVPREGVAAAREETAKRVVQLVRLAQSLAVVGDGEVPS